MALDEVDRSIVRILAGDGRMSYTDLAKKTSLSVSALHARVRRLEQRGVIAGYRALIDHGALGLPITALVAVRPFDSSAPDDTPERVAHIAAIESCYSVAGESSYVLLVRVASPVALEEVLAEIRSAAKVSTHSTVVLSTPYEGRPPAL